MTIWLELMPPDGFNKGDPKNILMIGTRVLLLEVNDPCMPYTFPFPLGPLNFDFPGSSGFGCGFQKTPNAG